MSAGDLSGLAGATWRQHLVGAADAASVAVGLATLARHLDAPGEVA